MHGWVGDVEHFIDTNTGMQVCTCLASMSLITATRTIHSLLIERRKKHPRIMFATSLNLLSAYV